MANLDACFSHKTDHWATPKAIYERIIRSGYYDPCPLHADFDGLQVEWPRYVFINPPYSKIGVWVDKALQESRKGKFILMLLPSRTDSEWFQKLVDSGSTFFFIRKRLSFGDRGQAPFPSVLVSVRDSALTYPSIRVLERDRLLKEGIYYE